MRLGRKQKSLQKLTRRAEQIPSSVLWGAAGLACIAAYRLSRRLREVDLNGRIVLITGGSRGLGFLLAEELASHGCRIAICGRDRNTLRRARRELERNGAEVITFQCDVGNADEMRDMIEAVTAHYGRIDILVNNAGIIQVGPVDTMTERDFRRALDVMFWAPLRATMAVVPQMRQRGEGHIVNVTSIGGFVSVPHLLPYNCAKFAAVGLSQGLCSELAPCGIRVTTIAPGTMRVGSHLNAEFRGDARREYRWFALAATLPGASIGGRRAARQIVRAIRRQETFRAIGLPAAITERLNGIMPATMARILSLINRVLPSAHSPEANGAMHGWEVHEDLKSGLLRAVTSAGTAAAEDSNQF